MAKEKSSISEETVKEETIKEYSGSISPEMLKNILSESMQATAMAMAEINEKKEAEKSGITPEMKAEMDKKREEEEKAANELVEIKLFKDSGKYKNDVFVAVNGQSIQIKRGVPVKIARKYAEVLLNSEKQDNATADLMEYESNCFMKEAEKHKM